MRLLQGNYKMNLDKNLFKSYWHLVCHKNEIAQDGDYVKFNTPLGDIVLFNDAKKIVAFDNKCAHRGTKIYQNNFGNQLNSCPYHKWTYRNSQLIIPDKYKFENCNINDVDIKKYQLALCGDFVFVGINPIFELEEQLGKDISDKIKNISFDIDKRIDFNRYDFNSYWGIAIENALEPNHLPFVHSKTLGLLGLGEGENVINGINSSIYFPIENQRIKKQLESFKKFFQINFQYKGYMCIYMFPFSMITSTFGYSYSVQNFFPSLRDENTTNFTSRLLTTKLSNEKYDQILSSFFESTININRTVFEEDHEICKLIPRDSWSIEPLKYMSTDEIKINHFRQICRDFTLSIEKNI
jgi:phenylpropionate dioxygenase-like ring-hydroxylating dioxygenase large terminal subunit